MYIVHMSLISKRKRREHGLCTHGSIGQYFGLLVGPTATVECFCVSMDIWMHSKETFELSRTLVGLVCSWPLGVHFVHIFVFAVWDRSKSHCIFLYIYYIYFYLYVVGTVQLQLSFCYLPLLSEWSGVSEAIAVRRVWRLVSSFKNSRPSF